jgi:hypothetical protein
MREGAPGPPPVSLHRRAGQHAVLLLVPAALLLSACGAEEPATTAQTSAEAQDTAEAAKENASERERVKAEVNERGETPRSPVRKSRTSEHGGDEVAAPGADQTARPDRSRPDRDSAVEQLEANVQQLLEGGEGERSGSGGSGLQIPPGLLDQGGKPTNPLEGVCLDPDECPGDQGS